MAVPVRNHMYYFFTESDAIPTSCTLKYLYKAHGNTVLPSQLDNNNLLYVYYVKVGFMHVRVYMEK